VRACGNNKEVSMRKRWMFPVALAMAGLGWTANSVFSQDMGGGEKPAEGGDPAADAAAAEMEMMQAWMKYMTPGEGHKRLQAKVGAWTVKGAMLEPGAPPTPLEGEVTMSLVLGGRFLRQEFKGTMTMQEMPMPMEGLGYLGFDNVLKTYQSTWMDSFGTGTFFGEGPAAADGKSFSTSGQMTNPTGGQMPVRSVLTDRSADEFVMEMFMKSEGAEEVRFLELVYTRKK
jgi:hypothetical protein